MKIIILLLLVVNVYTSSNLKMESISSSAEAAIVMECNSGRIIYQKNKDKQMLTASICKILTCITAIENGNLEKYCEVTKKVTEQIGSSIYLQLNDKVKLIDLLYGLMLRSGNDAAYLIAENCGGYDNFIILMNETAKKIGMSHSTFANPSGLDETTKNYSTAYDMALLMRYCSNNSTYIKINSCKSYYCETFNGNKMYFNNKHKLITSYDYIIGGKTGYTQNARRTLVTYAKKDRLRIVVVTFNCSSDFSEHLRSINECFENYQMRTIISKQLISVDSKIVSFCPILYEDLIFPLKDDEINRISCRIEIYKNPSDFRKVGRCIVYLDNQEVTQRTIYRYFG